MEHRMSTEVDIVRSQWGRLGIALGGTLAPASPDVERLLLDSAHCAAQSPQIVIAAVTWLSRFGNLIAEHRLHAMMQREAIDRPRFGLILALAIESARQHDRRRNLSRTLKLCGPAPQPQPFFTISAGSAVMIERARRRASPLSRAWNLWMDPIEPKYDALRTATWIVEQNPTLRVRADFRGDLRASILLCLVHELSQATISQLARLTGASRLATTHALDELELGGHVACERVGRMRLYRCREAARRAWVAA